MIKGELQDGQFSEALTESQRASVAELFSRKTTPERVTDHGRKLRVTMHVTKGKGNFPQYEPFEDASWWGHRGKLEPESRRPGIKAYIARTETVIPPPALHLRVPLAEADTRPLALCAWEL